jgi:hypothetical protein
MCWLGPGGLLGNHLRKAEPRITIARTHGPVAASTFFGLQQLDGVRAACPRNVRRSIWSDMIDLLTRVTECNDLNTSQIAF